MNNESGPFRLTGRDDANAMSMWHARQRAEHLVAKANVDAARAVRTDESLDPSDPRWVLAVRTQTQLQGTILVPERREKLLRMATRLGLSSFDANVIISLVQDSARRHGTMGDAAKSIAMVAGPESTVRHLRQRSLAFEWWRWLAAAACAVTASALMVRWIVA